MLELCVTHTHAHSHNTVAVFCELLIAKIMKLLHGNLCVIPVSFDVLYTFSVLHLKIPFIWTFFIRVLHILQWHHMEYSTFNLVHCDL